MSRIRTGYSFKAAVGTLDDVAQRLKDIGRSVAPITDRCSTFGWGRWTKVCNKLGMRPVYGVEIGVTTERGHLKPCDYWTFIAKDDLRSVHDLIAKATGERLATVPFSAKEPRLLYSEAATAKGVIKIAGHMSLISNLGNLDFEDPDLYFALSPAVSKGYFREVTKRGGKWIASSDNVYPCIEDREFYRIALGGRLQGKGDAAVSGGCMEVRTYPQHIMTDEEYKTRLYHVAPKGVPEAAIDIRTMVLNQCTAELQKCELPVPAKPKSLALMCEEGAKRLGIDLSDNVYSERVDRELALIQDKNFEDYFYILADIVQFAKCPKKEKHNGHKGGGMLVGPGRGSACGSLVCYLLGITSVDPIPYGLIFERFIDATRNDMPDIDVDFSDKNRHKVFDYMEAVYGVECVARLGTVGMFGARSALKQACRCLQINEWEAENAMQNEVRSKDGDERALNCLQDTLEKTHNGKKFLANHPEIKIAFRLEGHPSYAGEHASGVVVTKAPLAQAVAIDKRGILIGSHQSVMCDMYDAIDMGMLKIDALGLTQLSVFERAHELVCKDGRSANQFYLDMPLENEKAFEVLNTDRVSGIFQFSGHALRHITKQTKVTRFEDMVAITALARPGPDSSTWIRRKLGHTDPAAMYAHKLLEPILQDTLGVIVYQEQLMRVFREFGELPWADVNALRRAMAKSQGREAIDKIGGTVWKKTAIEKHGMTPENAERFWTDMTEFGAYAFNKSHAAAYSIVSAWGCYMKAHYPVEFAAATLDAESQQARQLQILREMVFEGISYVPVDAAVSTDKWEVSADGKTLVGPLSTVIGIGPVGVRDILEARATGVDVKAAVARKLAGKKTTIDTLWPIQDRVNEIYPDGLSVLNIVSIPVPICDVQPNPKWTKWEPFMIIGICKNATIKSSNEEDAVARRGGIVYTGATTQLNFGFRDDTDEILCIIGRNIYETVGKRFTESNNIENSIWAVKGTCPPDFRMLWVENVRYLGEYREKSVNEDDDEIPF